jgi:excisionase family DNA binding protein
MYEEIILGLVENLSVLVRQIVKEEIAKSTPAIPLDRPLLNLKEAAEYLNISTHTLYKMNRKKVIPTYDMGKNKMYRREDLDNYLLDPKKRKASSSEIESQLRTKEYLKKVKKVS